MKEKKKGKVTRGSNEEKEFFIVNQIKNEMVIIQMTIVTVLCVAVFGDKGDYRIAIFFVVVVLFLCSQYLTNKKE